MSFVSFTAKTRRREGFIMNEKSLILKKIISMPTSEVLYIDNLRTQYTHIQSGAVVITDAPIDNRGKGEMFSPTDLVATSLAGCILTIMGIMAETFHFDIKGTRAEVTKVMSTNPRRIGEIIVAFYFPPNNYSDKQREALKQSVKSCPVALSLHPDIQQQFVFHF
jgi:putative redox protein